MAARERGKFTEEEGALARKWTTCAVGEQHAIHPSIVIYDNTSLLGEPAPGDPVLAKLGSSLVSGFSVTVRENDFDAADRLLDAIEDRVLQLKREATA